MFAVEKVLWFLAVVVLTPFKPPMSGVISGSRRLRMSEVPASGAEFGAAGNHAANGLWGVVFFCILFFWTSKRKVWRGGGAAKPPDVLLLFTITLKIIK